MQRYFVAPVRQGVGEGPSDRSNKYDRFRCDHSLALLDSDDNVWLEALNCFFLTAENPGSPHACPGSDVGKFSSTEIAEKIIGTNISNVNILKTIIIVIGCRDFDPLSRKF